MDITVIHSRLLQLLSDFDRLCKQNNIEYTLHGGTLLGAIREKGFIPWDDDADISMTREEFEKLKSCLKRNNSQYYIRGTIKSQFCDNNNADVWIDIFVCDYITGNKILQKVKILLLTVLDIMLRDKNSIKYSNTDNYSKIKQIIFYCIYYFGKLFKNSWKQSWYILLSKKGFKGQKNFQIRTNDQFVGRKIVMPSKWMNEFIDIPFESTNLRVTKYYTELLTSSYGSNFMTPVKETRINEIHDQIRNNGFDFGL